MLIFSKEPFAIDFGSVRGRLPSEKGHLPSEKANFCHFHEISQLTDLGAEIFHKYDGNWHFPMEDDLFPMEDDLSPNQNQWQMVPWKKLAYVKKKIMSL